MKRKSLLIAAANPAVAATVFFLLEIKEHIPRWLEYLFYPLFWYFTLSFLISFGGIVIGLMDIKGSNKRLLEVAGVIGNAAYFIVAMLYIGKLWPALMGV